MAFGRMVEARRDSRVCGLFLSLYSIIRGEGLGASDREGKLMDNGVEREERRKTW